MRTLGLACTAAVILMGSAFAAPYPPTVMQFEVVTGSDYIASGTPYFEDGYYLTATGQNSQLNAIYGPSVEPFINSNSTAIFGWCNETSIPCRPVFSLDHGGELFDFNAIDVANLITGPITGALAIELSGYKWRDGVVTQLLPIVQNTWTTYSLTGFTDVVWVTITAIPQGVSSDGDVAMDNLVLTYVPEPGSLALLLGGLLGAAFPRRRPHA